MRIPDSDEQRPGLNPPQFRLSTLMWVVAFLCAVFAMMAAIGALAAWGLVLLVLAIFAHVAGNSLGTRLRDNGNRSPNADDKATQRDSRGGKVYQHDFAPTTSLSQRDSLGLTTIITTGACAIIGIALGGGFLALANWEQLNWASLAVAGIASGVIGGLIGFLISGFVHVMLVAYLQAMRHEKRK